MDEDLPESEVDFSERPSTSAKAWLCRPCERYISQYNDCKSLKARVHQYFVFGESLDCSQWKRDFDNCLEFRKTGDESSLQKVIESELKRKEDRERTVRMNDVWEYRSKPPEDWNKPLPQWFAQQNQFSLLARRQRERQSEAKSKLNDKNVNNNDSN